MRRRIGRRDVLALGAGAVAAGLAKPALVSPAFAGRAAADAAIAGFTGDVAPQPGRITLDLPERAENGNGVALSVAVESAMIGDDIVEALMIVAEDNPNIVVLTARFSAMTPRAALKTRIRLARSQYVIAVARMADGRAFTARRYVDVVIGGCGS